MNDLVSNEREPIIEVTGKNDSTHEAKVKSKISTTISFSVKK